MNTQRHNSNGLVTTEKFDAQLTKRGALWQEFDTHLQHAQAISAKGERLLKEDSGVVLANADALPEGVAQTLKEISLEAEIIQQAQQQIKRVEAEIRAARQDIEKLKTREWLVVGAVVLAIVAVIIAVATLAL